MEAHNSNPYSDLKRRYDIVDQLRRDTEAQVLSFNQDFLKVYGPDRVAFDDLLSQAIRAESLQTSLDDRMKIYIKMLIYYKKWLPIMEQIYAASPEYRQRLDSLRDLLVSLEKK